MDAQGPSLEQWMTAGPPAAALDEAHALSEVERRLFGRARDPITFSRYVLLDRLGRGSSGVVFRAYDPQLDRRVAIKLMQAGSEPGSRGRTRLLREAQALARLSDPNVVTVHDFGAYDARDLDRGLAIEGRFEVPRRGVFLVMELVQGLDLDAWRRGQEPSRREVLEVYAMAGRGLAAAHAAELVHRDFKPHNVLLGDDGRVRVLDFGLVRHLSREGRGDDRPAPAASEAEADSLELSRTGGLVGTLAYMAPEQHRGEPADSRSDQYAFALSLVEALMGRRPFEGDAQALAEAKAEGPEGRLEGLPKGLQAILGRALAADPDARYPDMRRLLAALEEQERRPRRRRWWAAGAFFGAAAGIALMLASEGPDPMTRCMDELAASASSWPGASAARVEAAFTRTGLPDASEVYIAVDRSMRDWWRRWREAGAHACQDARRSDAAASVARERACLERRRREAEVLAGLWGEADAQLVRHALPSIAELGRPEDCASAFSASARRAEQRSSPAIEEALTRLAEARVLNASGRYAEALDRIEGAVVGLDPAAAETLRAETAFARAAVLERRGELEAAEAELLRSIWAAEANQEDELAADAWLHLVWIVGVEARRIDDGQRWLAFAEAAVARLGHDALRRATLEHNRAGLDFVRGRKADALAGYRRALEGQRSQLGPEHPDVAQTLNHIGNVLLEGGEFEAALDYATRSHAIRVRALGPRHPKVAASLDNIALAHLGLGQLEAALGAVDGALEITRGSGGPEEWRSWRIRRDLLERLGDGEGALAAAREASRLDRWHEGQRR